MPKFKITVIKHMVTEYEIEAPDSEEAYDEIHNGLTDAELLAAETSHRTIYLETEINEVENADAADA